MASKKNPPLMPRLVADDNGYADHKIAWLDENGRIMTGKVPSMIEAGGQGLSSTTGQRIGVYRVGDVEYTCSSAVSSPMKLRNSDYPVSTANRVLFNHAMARFGLLGMPIRGAVTLPFRDYFNDDGSLNVDLRSRTAENFMRRDVEVVGSQAQPDIQSIAVYSEALSAWFDWAIDEKGNLTKDHDELCELQGEMLVVDIGGSTTDLASLQMVDGELLINQGKSGTETVGVLDARSKLDELVRGFLAAEGVAGMTGHGGVLPNALLGSILLNGKGNYAGQVWGFEQQRDQACKAVAERVTSYIKSKVGNPATYYAILVVGGGAIVFRPWLEAIFPNAIFSDEFANARGALKYLRSQYGGE